MPGNVAVVYTAPSPIPSGLPESGTLSDSLRSSCGLHLLSSDPPLSLILGGPLWLVGFSLSSVRRMPPLHSPTCSRDSVRQHLPLHGTLSLHVFAIAQVRAMPFRPRARLDGSPCARVVSTWGYRGIRVGEASHPGPEGGEPPRLATINRVPVGGNAPRSCSIRLTPQGGAWIWIVHSSPPLRVAGRKTPAEALQKWLQKFQEYILPDSQAVLRELHDQWQAHPIPPPPPKASAGHRARSAPPSTVQHDDGSMNTGGNGDSQADSPDSLSQQSRSNRRVCKKAPPPSHEGNNPPVPQEDAARQNTSSGGESCNPPVVLTWDQISELARKPMAVERHLPRPCKGLFEQVLARCLQSEGPSNNPVPGIGDYTFILPKLILCKNYDRTLTYNQKIKTHLAELSDSSPE